MEDIQTILSSKKHNSHYLNRYIKLINHCKIANESLNVNDYVEYHHICPKAKDLFPQYSNFNLHSWNKVKLTSRQHIIAHILLHKTYKGSQTNALFCMLYNFNSNTNSRLSYRLIPTCVQIRYLASIRVPLKKYHSQFHKNKSTYKDELGNRFYLQTDSPLIKKLNLVGNNMGYKMSNESKQLMSNAKDNLKKIKLYFLDIDKKFVINEIDLNEYLAQGWMPYLDSESREYRFVIEKKKHSQAMSGKQFYYHPDGITPYGWTTTDNPDVKLLNLGAKKTEALTRMYIENAIKAKQANIGSKSYNNGIITKKFKEHPGDGWNEGGLERNVNSDLKRKAGEMVYWNDGIKNYFISVDDVPESHWIKGMKPRLKKNKPNAAKKEFWNDGIKTYSIDRNKVEPELHWIRGMIPRCD